MTTDNGKVDGFHNQSLAFENNRIKVKTSLNEEFDHIKSLKSYALNKRIIYKIGTFCN
jgi:hypothetical protein